MFGKAWTLAAGACVVSLLAGVGIAVSGSQGSAEAARKTRPTTLTLYSRSSTQTAVDNPPAGQSPGDAVVISAPLYTQARGGRSVGRFELHRVFTSTGGGQTRAVDQVTETLSQGQITSGGSNAFAGSGTQPLVSTKASQAVLGGTGRYRLARGELSSRLIQGNTIKFTHRLYLTR